MRNPRPVPGVRIAQAASNTPGRERNKSSLKQSEPYPSSEPDSPIRPEPTLQGGAKPKAKLSLEDYRSRQLQKETAKEKEE